MENVSKDGTGTEYGTLQRALAASTVIAMTAGSALVWYFNPSNVSFFPVCPLYAMTGLACPGCGLTRGFHALFHGDVLTALDYNAMLPAYGAFFGYLFVSLFLYAVRGRSLSMKIFTAKISYTFLVTALVFAVLRNLPYYPFSILYP